MDIPDKKYFTRTVEDLQDLYSDRGLKFTQGFEGMVPVQAYGWLDGKRFYFRYRSDNASLRLGPVNEAALEAHNELISQREEEKNSRLYHLFETDQISLERFKRDQLTNEAFREKPATGQEKEYYPIIVTHRSDFEGFKDHKFAGELNTTEATILFCWLIDHLEEVPLEEQKQVYDFSKKKLKRKSRHL